MLAYAGRGLASVAARHAAAAAGAEALAAIAGRAALELRALSSAGAGMSSSWTELARQGVAVNPCASPHHPAVQEGLTPEGGELSVQEAYTPDSRCFGCGPAHPDGLHLRSRRTPSKSPGALEALVRFDPKYCAFPGIINGGIITTVLDCHGNWAAAVALMDKGRLSRPPLTLTASMNVSFREPTPPDTDLLVRSRVVGIRETGAGTAMPKATVEVDVEVVQPEPAGGERVLAVGRGVYKRLGALRAL